MGCPSVTEGLIIAPLTSSPIRADKVHWTRKPEAAAVGTGAGVHSLKIENFTEVPRTLPAAVTTQWHRRVRRSR
jgi:hypothetical protein